MITLESFSYFAQSGKKTAYTKGVTLDNFYGTVAAACKFQVHNTAAEPTAGRKPEIEFVMAAAGNLPGFFETIHEQDFDTGLTFVTSSTSGTYTAQATSFDIWGAVEANVMDITGLSSSTTTDDIEHSLWGSSSTARRLYKLTITNSEGATCWPMIFGDATSQDGDRPDFRLPSIADGATSTFTFGAGGLTVVPLYSNGTNPKVVLSTTGSTLTAAQTGLSDFTSYYKAAS